MKEKVYIAPDMECFYLNGCDVILASGNDTLVDSEDIWNYGG